jgi:hypothetical protein
MLHACRAGLTLLPCRAGLFAPPSPGPHHPAAPAARRAARRKTIPDALGVREYIAANGVQRALVIGGGFIGLEMMENLVERWVGTVTGRGPLALIQRARAPAYVLHVAACSRMQLRTAKDKWLCGVWAGTALCQPAARPLHVAFSLPAALR